MKNFHLTTVATVAMAICAFCADVVQNTPTNPTCPPKGYKNLPYPGNCTKYIHCMDGIADVRPCLENQYFNPILGECDLIDLDHDCRVPVPLPERDPDCPAKDCKGILRLPDPNDCSSYWECVNGKKVKKTCREGLKFDKVTQMCDLERYVDCDEYVCTPNTPNNTKVPHDCDCSLYFICQNGQSVIQQCPPGTKYDYIEKDCVSADRVRCYEKSKITERRAFCTY